MLNSGNEQPCFVAFRPDDFDDQLIPIGNPENNGSLV